MQAVIDIRVNGRPLSIGQAISNDNTLGPVALLNRCLSGSPPNGGPAQVSPNSKKSVDERTHMGFGVERRWRDAKPLLSARDCWIVDRLNVDGVLGQKPFTDLATQMRVTDDNGQNVARGV